MTPGDTVRGFFHAQVIEHMSDMQAYIDKILAEAPPLTDEKRDKITQLFGGTAM